MVIGSLDPKEPSEISKIEEREKFLYGISRPRIEIELLTDILLKLNIIEFQ